ncbi:hypothetical protein NM688_g4164 [Phlebia brevispora]|uniref:Uncharacterized protein n=1 Tax=Phlebia brevispora TaxID=194682 RepID=A0ACC1T3U5_9APHY|nr:hypothetical protein NM688_g4164 [Phlebia brevispora]
MDPQTPLYQCILHIFEEAFLSTPNGSHASRSDEERQLTASEFLPALLKHATNNRSIGELAAVLETVFPHPEELLTPRIIFLRCKEIVNPRPKADILSGTMLDRELERKPVTRRGVLPTSRFSDNARTKLEELNDALYQIELRLQDYCDTNNATNNQIARLEKRIDTISQDHLYSVSSLAETVQEYDANLSAIKRQSQIERAKLGDKYADLEVQIQNLEERLSDIKLRGNLRHSRMASPRDTEAQDAADIDIDARPQSPLEEPYSRQVQVQDTPSLGVDENDITGHHSDRITEDNLADYTIHISDSDYREGRSLLYASSEYRHDIGDETRSMPDRVVQRPRTLDEEIAMAIPCFENPTLSSGSNSGSSDEVKSGTTWTTVGESVGDQTHELAGSFSMSCFEYDGNSCGAADSNSISGDHASHLAASDIAAQQAVDKVMDHNDLSSETEGPGIWCYLISGLGLDHASPRKSFQRRRGLPTKDEMTIGKAVLSGGTKSALVALRQPVMAYLCAQHIGLRSLEEYLAEPKSSLQACLETYRMDTQLTDHKGRLVVDHGRVAQAPGPEGSSKTNCPRILAQDASCEDTAASNADRISYLSNTENDIHDQLRGSALHSDDGCGSKRNVAFQAAAVASYTHSHDSK